MMKVNILSRNGRFRSLTFQLFGPYWYALVLLICTDGCFLRPLSRYHNIYGIKSSSSRKYNLLQIPFYYIR